MPTSDLLTRFCDKANTLWKKEDKLFLACSGGLDSVVLGQLLKDVGYAFEVLHVNFQLRGEESMRDESFVLKLSEEWGVPIRAKRFDTNMAMLESGHGVQETARDLRYNWFENVLQETDCRNKWLLTAHHADDQVETVLMNLFRGTGIAGLRGIKEKSGYRIRPLLSFFRSELEEYAEKRELRWVVDSSNLSSDYTRNFFRLELLPAIEKIFPAARQNVYETSKRMSEVEQIYGMEIDKIRKKLIQKSGNSTGIPVNLLKNIQPLDTILFAIFSEYGFNAHQIPELKKLLDAQTGKYIQSDTHRVLRNRDWILIDKLESKDQAHIVIENFNHENTFAEGKILMEKISDRNINTNSLVACIEDQGIQWPLILRPWKTGDYFYPLGMKKKKKISRFLTDLKLSKTEKENQWVLESDKKIIWVVGRRIDDRYKLKPGNHSYLQLTFVPRP